MELRALTSFVTIADCGSVSRAAEILLTAQPSLSRQLRRFESELGFDLFERGGRRLELTTVGRRFLPVARDLVTRAALAQEMVNALQVGAPGSIMLSAPHTTATDLVAPFLASWGEGDPLPMVWEKPSAEVYTALESGADLAFGVGPPPPQFHRLFIAQLPVWAYVRPDHYWAGRESISLAELSKEQLLVLESGQHSRAALSCALNAADLAIRAPVEFETAEVAQAVAAAGRGIAVVSDDPRYGLLPLRIDRGDGDIGVRLYAAWSDDHFAQDMLQDLATRFRSFTRERFPKTRSN